MKNEICLHCNSNMGMIDRYKRFLGPDEIEGFSGQQSTAYLNAKKSGKLRKSIINVEIYKCPNCGSYHGVEYFKEGTCLSLAVC